MLTRTLIGTSALWTAALLLSGCGGGAGGSSGSMPVMGQPQPQTQQVDTEQLLAMAQVASETTDPKPVGNGALMVADADDQTSDPIPVG
jgi:hypothetical protein